MPAKRIAGMARSYRYPQADRRNCTPVCCATARRLDDGGSPTKVAAPGIAFRRSQAGGGRTRLRLLYLSAAAAPSILSRLRSSTP